MIDSKSDNILYTTHCPRCNVLKSKLDKNNIHYQEFTDTDKMIEKGFTTTPIFYADGKNMSFVEAMNWVNKKGV